MSGANPLPFVPFDLERWQSVWEHRVRFNLSESGVHPLSTEELLGLSGGSLDQLAGLGLGYPQGNGSDTLRDCLAALYPGATRDQVLVTVGSAEANFVACWALLERGDRVAIVSPAYRQTWGLARNTGATITEITLDPERDWEPDPGQIERAIVPGTKLVIVTNPNNPTGRVLSPGAREAILARVRSAGAWLLADEVYQGAERNGQTTPSFWGGYEKALITNGLSKAYGLPGLRIGWIVGPAAMIEALWQRHDYAVIGPGTMSDFLAIQALRARDQILARTRGILNTNYPILDTWLRRFGELFSWRTPDAGAICFVRYRHSLGALDLVERVRAEHNILLVPGEHFGMPNHLRLGFGNEPRQLEQALADLGNAFEKLLTD